MYFFYVFLIRRKADFFIIIISSIPGGTGLALSLTQMLEIKMEKVKTVSRSRRSILYDKH